MASFLNSRFGFWF